MHARELGAVGCTRRSRALRNGSIDDKTVKIVHARFAEGGDGAPKVATHARFGRVVHTAVRWKFGVMAGPCRGRG